MSDLPTGTVTLLFTDIEGSTRLVQHLGRQYSEVLSECRSLPDGVQLRVRMGLHTGEPSVPARATSAWTCIALRAS